VVTARKQLDAHYWREYYPPSPKEVREEQLSGFNAIF